MQVSASTSLPHAAAAVKHSQPLSTQLGLLATSAACLQQVRLAPQCLLHQLAKQALHKVLLHAGRPALVPQLAARHAAPAPLPPPGPLAAGRDEDEAAHELRPGGGGGWGEAQW
jgi:hypothetical protein